MTELSSAQAVFNDILAPHFLRGSGGGGDGGNALVRIHRLSQERFPSWCAGPCGCARAAKVRRRSLPSKI